MICTFRVEGIPPTYNQHFHINYGHRTCYLSEEARNFKTKVKMAIPPVTIKDNTQVVVAVAYHHQFICKNGKNKRMDLQNLDKLLIDAIFEKIGVDDSCVWALQEIKVNDTKSYTEVTLSELL